MIKKLIQLGILLSMSIIILVNTPVIPFTARVIYSSPCDQPVRYKIGSIDARFNLSREEFQSDINKAETIWDESIGKSLFTYDPNNPDAVTMSMIYDDRQSLTSQIGTLENQLNTEKGSIDPQITKYNNMSAEFKSRMNALNSEITYWNSKGGAPQEEFDTLKKEQQSLQQEADTLNAMAKSVNQSTDSYNAEVGQLNQTVGTFNSAIQLRPEEGLYDPKNNTITIYFNISHNELVHTLTHEMGHALGLDHNVNPLSIMYPKTTTAITPSPNDISDVQKICQKKTIFDRIGRIITLIQNQKNTMSTPSQ